MEALSPPDPEAFIAHWKNSDASELSTAQSFLNDLIRLIGADRPDPSHAHGYSFEYPVTFQRTGTPGRIDLYKRGHFVLEAKRGALPTPPAQLPLLPGAPARRPDARPGTTRWSAPAARPKPTPVPSPTSTRPS